MVRQGLTPAERGAKGGHARTAALTPEQRSESARRAVQARWAKARARPAPCPPSVIITANVVHPHPATSVTVVRAFGEHPLVVTSVGTWCMHASTVTLTNTPT